ncbi:MAG: signal peptidase [Microbacteriaceae bacterium]|jgi:signal peptidase I|nr:signal peptidase [Microbacteriaceae bacterium]
MTSEVQPVGQARNDDSGQAPQQSRVTEKQRNSRGAKLFIRDILLIFLAALLISFLIKTFLIRSFYIPSESMMDTLHVNDRIIVNLLEPDLVPIEHGDVVVFTDPASWLGPPIPKNQNPISAGIDAVLGFVGLSAPDSDDHLIKRVIGLPGDEVQCCNDLGQMLVNGVPLEEPYTVLGTATKATANDFTITVPKGSLWVMGDNRYDSADSSYHYAKDPETAFVPIDNVVGRAVLVTWPLDRWAWLDNYPIVFRGVDAAGD